MRRIIRLTEQDLARIVRRVINEEMDDTVTSKKPAIFKELKDLYLTQGFKDKSNVDVQFILKGSKENNGVWISHVANSNTIRWGAYKNGNKMLYKTCELSLCSKKQIISDIDKYKDQF